MRVVETGSFTAVAAELRVKQSTVSKWMAALEDELGVRLLDRTTRSQRVTESGQRFYHHVRALISGYDAAVADAQRNEPTLRGRIRVSLPMVFGRLFVVPQIAKFLRRHKAVEIDMRFNDRYVSLVEDGYDLAVRVGAPVDSTLVSHALGASPRRLVASPGYVRAHGEPRSPRALAQHECLVHSDAGARASWKFGRGGKSHRVSVAGRLSVNNSEATAMLARGGFGICLLASWLVDPDIRAGRLVHLLPDYVPPAAPVRALTAPGRHTAPRVRALIDHLREGLATTLVAGMAD